MSNLIRYGLVPVLLLILQFSVFNNISFGYGITVFVYVLFFLVLPLRLPGWALLLIGFATGLIVDSVFNTGGVHAFASVFTMFMRPNILKTFEQSFDYDTTFRPGTQSMGFTNFIKYTISMTFIHNFVLFYLEVLTLKSFFFHLLIVIANTLLTTLFCVVFEALFKKEKSR